MKIIKIISGYIWGVRTATGVKTTKWSVLYVHDRGVFTHVAAITPQI